MSLFLTFYFLFLLVLAGFYLLDYKVNSNNNFKNAKKILDRKLTTEIINVENSDTIPKNILQTYKKKDLIPEHISKNIKNKNEGWDYQFYDEKNSKIFLRDEFGEEFVKKYESFKNRAHKEDLFKLCWLYKNGGVFVDIDIELVLPLDEIVEGIKNNFGIMHNDFRLNYYDDIISEDLKEIRRHQTLVNPLIMSSKGNPKIKRCIENIMKLDQSDLYENYAIASFIMKHSLVDVENFQFFERSGEPFYPFVTGKMEIYDINDRKIANSSYSNLKDGKFN